MKTPQDVLAFWLDEVGPAGWYSADAALDLEITQRFLETWQNAAQGGCGLWLTCASETLAYIILTDQFPRNMFRDKAAAFATDGIARTAAKMAVNRDWDMKIDEPARQFFYLPLMHSENLADQDRGVRLIKERMPETGESNLLHARAHRRVIRDFGRFPHRNAALDRATSAEERDFLAAGGYGAVVRELQGG